MEQHATDKDAATPTVQIASKTFHTALQANWCLWVERCCDEVKKSCVCMKRRVKRDDGDGVDAQKVMLALFDITKKNLRIPSVSSNVNDTRGAASRVCAHLCTVT